MNDISLAHASWLRPFDLYFHKRGIDLTRYYKAAKIKPGLAASEDGWLTKQQLYSFLNLVAEEEQMPELGFVVGETMTPDSIGIIGTELVRAETLYEAVHLFCRLINRHVENNRSWLKDSNTGEVWLLVRTLNPFPADRRIADHAGLMTLINVVRFVSGPDWYPEKIKLQTEESHAFKKVQGLQHVAAEFNAPATGLAFPSTWLYRRVLRRTDGAAKGIDELLLNTKETISEKIRRLLPPLVGTGGMSPSLKLLAHICGMNSRTLQRRLREDGHTFGEILEQFRMKKAMHLLNTDLSIKEIAWELGYSGPNNFIRAFKRCNGLTPTIYRKKHQTY